MSSRAPPRESWPGPFYAASRRGERPEGPLPATLARPASVSREEPPSAMAIPGEKAIEMVRRAHAQAAQLDIAVTKAYTAASFQQPTKELAAVAGQSWFQSLVVSSNGRIMPGAGALPIVEGGSVVGAIAVAGGTEEQDQRCAEVALASYV